MGLRLLAPPTARTAVGLPIDTACCVTVLYTYPVSVSNGLRTRGGAQHLNVRRCGAEGNAAQGRPRHELELGAARVKRQRERRSLSCEVLAQLLQRHPHVLLRSAAAAATRTNQLNTGSVCRKRMAEADAAYSYIRRDNGELAERCIEACAGEPFGGGSMVLGAGRS